MPYIEFEYTAERRLAAASLAIRLYRCDCGHWPNTLGALVDKYLPSIPDDPFYDGHSPVGYIILRTSNGEDRPMIYIDCTNNAASTGPPATPCFDWAINASRQWRDLTYWWMPQPVTRPAH